MIMNYKLLPILVIILSAYIFAEPKFTLDFPPSESMTVYEPSVQFKGRIEDAKTVQINGLDIPILFDGSFDYTVKLNEDQGVNYFMIEVSDDVSTIQYQRNITYIKSDSKKKPIISTRLKPKPRKLVQLLDAVEANSPEYEFNKNKMMDTLKKYIGYDSRGSYTFSKISLADFITIFSKEHQLNIINDVISEKTLTVELNSMHPVDVFDTLISYWGCKWVMKDNIIIIVESSPIRVFQLNYIKGETLIDLVSDIVNITRFKTNPIDNSLIAQGSNEELDHLEELIKKLDVRPKQVLIEATIVETNFDLSTILGTNPADIIKGSSSGTSPFNFDTLGYSFPVSVFENNSNANILANPQILVTNHNTASINTGNSIGYTTTTVTETSTIENMRFLTTGITLLINPLISDTGEILMDISPTMSDCQVSEN